jgi:flagellar basal body-associated protein FliL
MNRENKQAGGSKMVVIVSVLFILSLSVNIAVFFKSAKDLKAAASKTSQQALIINEKDKQLESDKALYTSLAARLHTEIKKAGELEEALKKCKGEE